MILKHKSHLLNQSESVYGDGGTGWAGTDAVQLLTDMNPPRMIVEQFNRMLHQQDFSASDNLPGSEYMEFSFRTELFGAGSADGIPKWGRLLQQAGFSRTVVSSNCVKYTTATDSLTSGAYWWQMDGLRITCKGAYNDVTLNLGYNDIARATWTAKAFGLVKSAETKIAPDFTGWNRSWTVLDKNTGDIKFGSSLNGTTGAITGGTAYPSKGIPELRIGNEVVYDPLLGGESVYIASRSITAQVELRLTPDQFETVIGEVEAGTETSLSFTIGSATGRRLSVFGPRVERHNPEWSQHNKEWLLKLDLTFLSTVGGANDALTIVTR